MPYSCISEELRTKLNEYIAAYNDAEKALKLFEISSSEGLIFPAVNELRCAGQHVARSFSAETQDASLQCMGHAIQHARRALYDAYDAGINYSLGQCKNFQEDYRHEVISHVNSNYSNEKYEIEQLVHAIAQENRSQPEMYAMQKESQFSKIKLIADKWDSTREELNKSICLRRRGSKLQAWMLIIAILGLSVTILVA